MSLSVSRLSLSLSSSVPEVGSVQARPSARAESPTHQRDLGLELRPVSDSRRSRCWSASCFTRAWPQSSCGSISSVIFSSPEDTRACRAEFKVNAARLTRQAFISRRGVPEDCDRVETTCALPSSAFQHSGFFRGGSRLRPNSRNEDGRRENRADCEADRSRGWRQRCDRRARSLGVETVAYEKNDNHDAVGERCHGDFPGSIRGSVSWRDSSRLRRVRPVDARHFDRHAAHNPAGDQRLRIRRLDLHVRYKL